jgi:hypothetical protein
VLHGERSQRNSVDIVRVIPGSPLGWGGYDSTLSLRRTQGVAIVQWGGVGTWDGNEKLPGLQGLHSPAEELGLWIKKFSVF